MSGPRPKRLDENYLTDQDRRDIDSCLDYTDCSQGEQTILRYIAWHIKENMTAPTFREIAMNFGVSPTIAQKYVERLIFKGRCRTLGKNKIRGTVPTEVVFRMFRREAERVDPDPPVERVDPDR